MRLQGIAATAALLFAGAALAADKPCTPADATKAEKAADMSNNWVQLHKTFKDYGHCDTGNTSEVFVDATLRLIVPWEKVKEFEAELAKDPEFKKWVFAKLKSPSANDDRYTVYKRAKAQCPSGMDAFCGEILEVTKDP
jgi:hypothetical protein